jgi:thioredoxin reductase (NADPH)
VNGEPASDVLDLLVVGAGPTALAIGADARQAGMSVLLVERGALTQAMLEYPVNMTFFTTRDLLEIAGVPFAVPDDKPSRQQALVYYRGVAARHALPLALHEEVVSAEPQGEVFAVRTHSARDGERVRRARAVALATGYFGQPRHLGVPGEELPWVHARYREPYPHFGEHVAVVGGGNSAAEAALDLWRNGARVTLVHRGAAPEATVKYWVKPDLENRVAAGQIAARFSTTVTEFKDGALALAGPEGRSRLPVDAAYVLIGYAIDVDLLRRCGVRVDERTQIPTHDPETCESNVPGLYVAGTLQAGKDTGKIFIENSRDHGAKIVRHFLGRARRPLATPR